MSTLCLCICPLGLIYSRFYFKCLRYLTVWPLRELCFVKLVCWVCQVSFHFITKDKDEKVEEPKLTKEELFCSLCESERIRFFF